MRTLQRIYGVAIYGLFLATFLYLIGFIEGAFVPRSVHGPVAPGAGGATDIAVNVALLVLFAVQHAIMARRGFKRAWTKIVPQAIERSTFMLATCACLALTFTFWRPLPGVLWDVQAPAGRVLLWSVAGLGWATVLLSTFLLDHFALFGLKQSWSGGALPDPPFRTPFLYRVTRHPLYLGFLIAFWATPTMTYGGLLYAAVTSLYVIAVGIRLEERDLVAEYGERYERYRRSTRMILPVPRS